MSRNFELLQQADRNRDLFQTQPPLPPMPAAGPASEEPEPEKPAANERRTEEQEAQVKKERFTEPPPGNGYRAADELPSRSLTPSKWFASLREGTNRLGISSNAHRSNGHGRLDVRAMALQEEIKLVQRVFFSSDAGASRAIVFSGVENGEGSARICARAAETLAAQVQSSVCVVDANLHSPSLHQYFGTKNILGLSEAVLQSGPIRNYAQQLEKSNLWLIPCGAAGANSWALLNPDGVRARFAELRKQFDYVLINAPPMNVFADSALICQFSDGVILVVEANSTRRETAQRLKECLEEADVQVRGVVLNNRTFPIPESVYRKL